MLQVPGFRLGAEFIANSTVYSHGCEFTYISYCRNPRETEMVYFTNNGVEETAKS